MGAPRRRRGEAAEDARPRSPRKLGYKDQRELDALPGRIEDLTAAIAKLESDLADPDLFSRDPAAFTRMSETLAARRAELAAAEERWLELETAREALAE